MEIKFDKLEDTSLYISHFFNIIPRIEKGRIFWFEYLRKEIHNKTISLFKDYSKIGSCVVFSGSNKNSPKNIEFIKKNQFVFFNKYRVTVNF